VLKVQDSRLANPFIGSLWMLASSFLFAGMGVFVKLGSADLTAAELLFYRSLLGLLFTYSLIRYKAVPLKTRHWRKHMLRGVVGFAAMMSLFLAITLLPVATAMTLNYTSPIFLAVVALVLQRDRMRRTGYLAIASGFIGVALLLRPTIHSNDWVGECLGLGSGFLAGIAIYHTRQLGRMGEPSSRIVFYFMLICLICSGSWMIVSGISDISLTTAIWILGVGLLGTGGQLAMTRAYSITHSVAVSSLTYSTILFTCVFGVLLFGDSFDLAASIGIALIVFGGIIASYSDRTRSSAEP
jgi:drug/metabolite transporter (DMT)-like permease